MITLKNMDVTLAYPSSLDYWRYISSNGGNVPTIRCALMQTETPCITREEAHRLATLGIQQPVHVFCANPKQRRSTGRIACHVTPFEEEREEFVLTQDRLQVSTPELCLAQAATKLSFPHLLMLCYELCGTYRMDSYAKEGYIAGLKPLTTVAKCRDFVESNHGVRGTNALRRALTFVTDNSPSPEHSRLAILFSLPFCYGGYNLPLPVLNATVVIGTGVFTAEMYWPAFMMEARLGAKGPSSREAFTQRMQHGDAVVFVSPATVVISRKQIAKRDDLSAIAASMAKQMKLRVRPRTKKYPLRQTELRIELGLDAS